MKVLPIPSDFAHFRNLARTLLQQEVAPANLCFSSDEQPLFFFAPTDFLPAPIPKNVERPDVVREGLIKNIQGPLISARRLRWLQTIAMHRADDTWHLLYRLLWKAREKKSALENPADVDVLEGERRAKQVSRDIHKMHAFVRFHKSSSEPGEDEYFLAWHRPQHKTLRAGSSFFVKRFGSMIWSILTPDESAHWNMKELRFGPGVPEQPNFSDEMDAHWLTYYRSIFNPARIKISAMKKEMPVRYWESMPETRLIPELLDEAPARVKEMRRHSLERATIPKCATLEELRSACGSCSACPIACLGGRSVFGEGPAEATTIIVGEQPGDEEDRAGRPFVGPAGKVLDEVLEASGVLRSSFYVTNAVKHFKWIPRGKRRLHQRPTGAEILACRPWLSTEFEMLKPKVIICLGATAAQAVLGLQVAVKDALRSEFPGPGGSKVYVTYHPSAVLRAPSPEKRAEIIDAIVHTFATFARNT